MTDKDIQEAIENCFWRTDIGGVYVCSGDVVPCNKHIYDGKCPTLIELYGLSCMQKESGDDNG